MATHRLMNVAEQLRSAYRRVASKTLLRAALIAGATVGLAANPAVAQFNQTGGFGQTGFGQTGFGQTGFGQTGMGQTGFGQTGQTGFGQLGQTGMGQTGFGQAGQAGGFGQTGQAGQAGANPFGSGGMMGQTNAFGSLAGAALLNRGLQGGGLGGMGAGGFGGMGGLGGRGGRGGMNSFNQNQNQNSNKPQIRATVKLGFDIPAPPNAETSRVINDRLRRIPSPVVDGVTVSMQGRTAVIRGQVDSPAAGKVIERLLSLEPGVDAVKNELTFATGQGSAAGQNAPVPPTPRPPVPNRIPTSSSTNAAQPSATSPALSAPQSNSTARPSGTTAEIVPAPELD